MSVSESHAYLEIEAAKSLRRILEYIGLSHLAGAETEIVKDSSTFTRVKVQERRADLLFRIVGPTSATLIIEVQRAIDPMKRASWLYYAVDAYLEHGDPAYLVVLTDDPSVAEWASLPIEIVGGSPVTVFVIGPDQLPALLSRQEIATDLDFAVLTLTMRGRTRDVGELVRRIWHEILARRSSGRIDDRTLERYLGIMKNCVTVEWWQSHVEASMEIRTFFDELRDNARAQGIERGREEARAAARLLAINTVRRLAPELLPEVSHLEDPEAILERFSQYMERRRH